jgi:hypothetical protein
MCLYIRLVGVSCCESVIRHDRLLILPVVDQIGSPFECSNLIYLGEEHIVHKSNQCFSMLYKYDVYLLN